MDQKSRDFVKDFSAYFHLYPLMSRDPGGELDGNAILYAGSYGLLFHKLFGSYPSAPEHSAYIYKLSMIGSGRISRGPHKMHDAQAHDDYMGLCTLSSIGHGGVAKAIYEHGRRNFWFYKSGEKNLRNLLNGVFFRMPGLVQHIKACAGIEWGLIDILWWSIGVFGNAISSHRNTSGKILKWHMISVYEMHAKKNWLCDMAVRRWKSNLNNSYPEAMGGVFRVYYGASHPFVKWASGRI